MLHLCVHFLLQESETIGKVHGAAIYVFLVAHTCLLVHSGPGMWFEVVSFAQQ
jgi:hypothetical protein